VRWTERCAVRVVLRQVCRLETAHVTSINENPRCEASEWLLLGGSVAHAAPAVAMCRFALIGARSETRSLHELIGGLDAGLDTEVAPADWTWPCFPITDAVVCVTLQGCSCTLLEGVGSNGASKREAHFAGPGYSFRRMIAAAVGRFGSVRLLVGRDEPEAEPLEMRTTTLASFLRFGLGPDDKLLCITA
jgi:hypothetical protein